MGNRLVSITSDDMCDDVKRGNPKCNQHVMATVFCYMTGSCLLSDAHHTNIVWQLDKYFKGPR